MRPSHRKTSPRLSMLNPAELISAGPGWSIGTRLHRSRHCNDPLPSELHLFFAVGSVALFRPDSIRNSSTPTSTRSSHRRDIIADAPAFDATIGI